MSIATSKNCIFDLQNQRFKVFKSQDIERGGLNVAFKVQGKMIHVNSFILTAVSEPLDEMLSLYWKKKDEPIQIENYSYENFCEFITFLYTGRCSLTRGNVFHLVEIAELYDIPCFKVFCYEFLSHNQNSVEEIEEPSSSEVSFDVGNLIKTVFNLQLQNYGIQQMNEALKKQNELVNKGKELKKKLKKM